MSIDRMIARAAAANPDAIALLAPGRDALDYRHLIEHWERAAATLERAGIGRGDRVAMVLGNGPEMACCFLAVSKVAACAPLNPGYRASEFEYFLTELKPAALIIEEGAESPAIAVARAHRIRVIRLRVEAGAAAGIFTLEIGADNSSDREIGDAGGVQIDKDSSDARETIDANGAVDRADENNVAAKRADENNDAAERDDDALVLFTSGTTARPKMVPLTRANLAASVENIIATMPLTAADRCLNVMPLYHVSGLVGVLLATLATGGSVVCTPGFYAPQFFDWCAEFAPTWYFGVPTMHQTLLARARANPGVLSKCKLRFIRSGAAPLPAGLMTDMESVFALPVVEGYGLTETAMQVSINPLPPGVRKPGSVGLPGATQVMVVDGDGEHLGPGEMGEILVRGPAVFRGYGNDPQANAESFTAGWFRTGDAGRLDEDGYLFITGRIKEIVIRGGQKISPREVDEALEGHPDVVEAAAFGVRDRQTGERVAAAAVLRHSSGLTERELRSFAAARLADYKVPARIVFVDRIPKGPTGKLKRSELASYYGLDRDETVAVQASYVAPETATQKMLAAVWESVLGVAPVGIHDHFLALGGDSLLLAQVVTRLRERGGPAISMLTFFERPTVAGLASLIDASGARGAQASEAEVFDGEDVTAAANAEPAPEATTRVSSLANWPIQPHGTRPPLYVVGSFNAFEPLARRMGLDQPIIGVTVPEELKLKVPYQLEEIAESEAESILKAQDGGPFYLAGFSAEGVLAYEVAQQLARRGCAPELVVMIDSACPAVADPIVARMARNARIHAGHVASGGLEQLRKTASGIWRRLSLRLKIKLWRVARSAGVSVERPTPQEPMDVIMANVIASREYLPEPYAGRVILFKRTLEQTGRHRLADNGWGRLVRGGFEVVRVEGDHLALLAEPGVAQVAEKLAAEIGGGRDEASEIRRAASG